MTRILLALPYYNGDRVQMERVADLAHDLIETPTDKADILFVGRYDADPPSQEIVEHVREKFRHVNYWRCPREGVGFPEGCSEVAYGLFQYMIDQRRVNGIYLDVDCLLILESDCVITRRSWVEELLQEWEHARNAGKRIVGQVQHTGKWSADAHAHMNAVSLYDAEILFHLPCLVGGNKGIGWDYLHGPSTVPVAYDSNLFKLDYQKASITPEELFRDPRVLIYHGVKDDSAVNIVRRRNGI